MPSRPNGMLAFEEALYERLAASGPLTEEDRRLLAMADEIALALSCIVGLASYFAPPRDTAVAVARITPAWAEELARPAAGGHGPRRAA